MAEKNKKDRSHLSVVKSDDLLDDRTGKSKAKDKGKSKDKAKNDEGKPAFEYYELIDELTDMYYADWEGYISEISQRDDYIRTVIEIDDMGTIHPVFTFDNTPAPTAKAPKFTPEKYGVLDFSKISKEDEDTLLWAYECEGREYEVAFIPKSLIYKIEKRLHAFIEQTVATSERDGEKEFDPATLIAITRELCIATNRIIEEMERMKEEFLYDSSGPEDEDGRSPIEEAPYVDTRLAEEMDKCVPHLLECGNLVVKILF